MLIKVRAASLNAGDVKVMRGEPLLIRPAFGLRRPRLATRGMDVAGTVVALGPGVTELAWATRSWASCPAARSPSTRSAAASLLVHRPAELSPISAASLPLAGGTAWQALEAASVAAGQRVLVIGASGGVGTSRCSSRRSRSGGLGAVRRAQREARQRTSAQCARSTTPRRMPPTCQRSPSTRHRRRRRRSAARAPATRAAAGHARARLGRGWQARRADRSHPPRHPAVARPPGPPHPSPRRRREARCQRESSPPSPRRAASGR